MFKMRYKIIQSNNRFEDFLSLFKSYDHVAVGIKKIDKTIIGMAAYGAEIDVIDGKQFNLLKVCFVNIVLVHIITVLCIDWIGFCGH